MGTATLTGISKTSSSSVTALGDKKLAGNGETTPFPLLELIEFGANALMGKLPLDIGGMKIPGMPEEALSTPLFNAVGEKFNKWLGIGKESVPTPSSTESDKLLLQFGKKEGGTPEPAKTSTENKKSLSTSTSVPSSIQKTSSGSTAASPPDTPANPNSIPPGFGAPRIQDYYTLIDNNPMITSKASAKAVVRKLFDHMNDIRPPQFFLNSVKKNGRKLSLFDPKMLFENPQMVENRLSGQGFKPINTDFSDTHAVKNDNGEMFAWKSEDGKTVDQVTWQIENGKDLYAISYMANSKQMAINNYHEIPGASHAQLDPEFKEMIDGGIRKYALPFRDLIRPLYQYALDDAGFKDVIGRYLRDSDGNVIEDTSGTRLRPKVNNAESVDQKRDYLGEVKDTTHKMQTNWNGVRSHDEVIYDGIQDLLKVDLMRFF